MMTLAAAAHLNALSIAVLAGLIAVLGAEIIVSQREKKLVPAKIKNPSADPRGGSRPNRTTP